MPTKHKLIRLFFLILFGLSLALFGSLIIDRLLSKYLNRSGYFKALSPNIRLNYETSEFKTTATISAQGLRNENVVIPKPLGTYRILALGDSFTFGWGVNMEDSWPKKLERMLTGKNKQLEIINAGVPGVDLADELYICQAYTSQFAIDGLIIGLSTDDIYQAAARLSSVSWSTFWRENVWPTLTRINHPIINTSEFEGLNGRETINVSYVWREKMEAALQTNPKIVETIDPKLRDELTAGKINPFLLHRAIADPQFFTYTLDANLLNFALKAFKTDLYKLKSRCINKLPTILVYIPSSVNVASEYMTFYKQLGYEIDPRLIKIDLSPRLEQISKRMNFKYISVLSLLRQEGCLDCYYYLDDHLTLYGQQKVAQLIYPIIVGLIDHL